MLIRTVSLRLLLSTHTICFGWEIRILHFWYTLITKVLVISMVWKQPKVHFQHFYEHLKFHAQLRQAWKSIITSRPLFIQYAQYKRKESIFESLADLNLITLIIKSLFFSLLRFPTLEFLHLSNPNEEMRSHAQQICTLYID